jgi:uncharacterized membrane protein
MKSFSIEEALKFGWTTTKANLAFLFKAFLIVVVVHLLLGVLDNSAKDTATIHALVTALSWVVGIILDIGMIKIALKFINKQTPVLADLYNHYPLFANYALGLILSWLIIMGGLILLIVPGIIFAVRLQFVSLLILDKGLGPIEALKKSWQLTKGVSWNLFLFDLLIGLINILGALALGIGLLWTIPTTSIASAFVYKKLVK